mgnify:CR=1 FL=1
MKNKEKYDLRDISYDLEVDRGGYDFVIYYTSMEIYREFFSGSISTCSAFTKWLEEEYKPQILTEKENAYLSAVIKPFRNDVEYIEKCIFSTGAEYIRICLTEDETVNFPNFKRGTMYKGMETSKIYTLEELGL